MYFVEFIYRAHVCILCRTGHGPMVTGNGIKPPVIAGADLSSVLDRTQEMS